MKIGDALHLFVTFPGSEIDIPTHFIGVVSDDLDGAPVITICMTKALAEVIKPKVIEEWGE